MTSARIDCAQRRVPASPWHDRTCSRRADAGTACQRPRENWIRSPQETLQASYWVHFPGTQCTCRPPWAHDLEALIMRAARVCHPLVPVP